MLIPIPAIHSWYWVIQFFEQLLVHCISGIYLLFANKFEKYWIFFWTTSNLNTNVPTQSLHS